MHCCTNRSSAQGIPNCRTPPPLLGISCLRTGFGWYVPTALRAVLMLAYGAGLRIGEACRTKDGKVATLGPVAFLERFVEHVLPTGFVKIRHYGLLAPGNIPAAFAEARAALAASSPSTPDEPMRTEHDAEDEARDWRAVLLELTGTDLTLCPRCGARAMLRRPLAAARAPPAEAA
jgi:Putative transposase